MSTGRKCNIYVSLISGSFHIDNHLESLCVFMACIRGITIANTLDYS